jgi:hypothetical protein
MDGGRSWGAGILRPLIVYLYHIFIQFGAVLPITGWPTVDRAALRMSTLACCLSVCPAFFFARDLIFLIQFLCYPL